MSINSVNAGKGSIYQSQFEDIIQNLVKLQRIDQQLLESQKVQLNSKIGALDDVKSKVSGLLTITNSLSSEFDNNIGSLKAESTNSGLIHILSTGESASQNTYDITVDQLAKKDLVHSAAFTADGADLSSTGTGTFDITVGSNGPVTITVDTTGLTNKEVLEAVSQEISNQLGEQVEAEVFQVNSTQVQLSIKSNATGEDHRISIENVSGDFDDPVNGLNLSSYYAAGELNAKFTIDGIAFERSSNLIDDAINGISFELKGQTTIAEKIEVSHDTEASKGVINDFIKKFNEMNSTLRARTHVDGETNQRGLLYGERSLRNLTMDLRQIGFQQVGSLDGSDYSMLADLGIEFRQNGEMYIANAGKLNEALASAPDQVQQLFSASDGIAARFKERLDMFITGNDSTLSSLENSINSQIDRLNRRIESEEKYLERYEARIRKEYAALEELYTVAQSQMNQLQNMFMGYYY